MLIDEIRDYINRVLPKLQDRFDKREKVLLVAREVIRYSGETISLSHRLKMWDAKEKFSLALQKLEELKKIVNEYPELLYGDVGTAFQEAAEASIVLSMYFNDKLKTSEDLGIPETYYILGIADAIGEMRRRVLELLRKDQKDEAEKTFKMMEELYELLWALEYPKATVPGLRQKIDSLRKLIEETHHDLFLAHLE